MTRVEKPSRRRKTLVAAVMCVLASLWLSSVSAAGLVTVSDADWDEAAVRRVLHVFSYGGAATDSQIEAWADLPPTDAIQQMLSFNAVNNRLSPAEDITADYAGSLEALQNLWSSDQVDNLTCPSDRGAFDATTLRADGEMVLRNIGLQNTWISAVRKRGLNPFRHKVGFWLANYQMAVSLHDTKPPLIRAHYDAALGALARGAPFHEVLGGGAASAAVAREYGHQTNRYANNTGVFLGNDDFAREFHQLFFRINGVTEDSDYHENTTIEHTAWALTGMEIDKDSNAYGATRSLDWWVAPIDFTDHYDGTGRNVRNTFRHYLGSLEILHEPISGATAEEKLFNLAAVAIQHPESLDNIPVAIVNFFADDNLSADKVTAIQSAWRELAGTQNDLLRFLRAYAVSTAFHREDTFKYRTAFHRNMTIYNLNTVDNEEAYANAFSPRFVMVLQGAEVFIPLHDVFGGQTSLNAANNPNLFKEAYNRAVDYPTTDIAKTADVCQDDAGIALGTWRKDWARVLAAKDGVYAARDVGAWLWDRFIGDNGKNYGTLERAQVTALLATGMDFGYVADAANPDISYSIAELESEPLRSVVAANEAATLNLDSPGIALRREANRRVGMAINFITMTPFMFAGGGTLPIAPPPPPPDPNNAPVANAKALADVTVGDTANLDGSGSSDSDGDPLSFGWTLTNIPTGSGAVLSDPNAMNPSFVADMAGSYSIQLVVNDGFDDSVPATVTIQSTEPPPDPNSAPVANAKVLADVSVGDTVNLDGSGSSDSDGDPLSFGWTFTNVPTGSGAVLSDPNAMNPSFVADMAGSYSVQLVVNDGFDDSVPATVTIQSTQPPPPDEPGPPAVDPNGKETELEGVIQLVGAPTLPTTLVISGVTVWVTADTIVKFEDSVPGRAFAVGRRVEGKARPNVDGSLTAQTLEVR